MIAEASQSIACCDEEPNNPPRKMCIRDRAKAFIGPEAVGSMYGALFTTTVSSVILSLIHI